MGMHPSTSASMAPIWAQPLKDPLPSTKATVLRDGGFNGSPADGSRVFIKYSLQAEPA